MNAKEYQKLTLNTDLKDDYKSMIDRIANKRISRLLHGAIGLCTETGELQDALKKHIMYGKELDLLNMKEELGDVLWYVSLLINELDSSFEEIMEMNIKKLQKRYPQGFTPEAALKRNLYIELQTLKDSNVVKGS
jgi:NTP pyrophosphatase (non-canonical NTP hydrolase)